ncbi:MAG: hypothetical protein CALGDGBN_03115 [Pseudomonadales bacterium]|nr:hypothetical protein [Pseudomonadales bacterium]
MKNVVPFRSKGRIETEAAAWVVRIDGAELGNRDREQLNAWLAEDARHRAAFERLATVWGKLDCLELLAEIIPLPRKQSRLRVGDPEWFGWRRNAGLFALGCVFAVGLVFAGRQGLLSWVLPGGSVVESVYQTRTGEQSRILLGDGSKVMLNTRSEVRVRIDDRQRAVYLSTGEAFFEVAPNPRVPFVVYAGHGAVRAVGTGFNVRIMEQSVEVTVTEGSVSVSTRQAPRPDEVTVRAGGAARYARQVETPDYPSGEHIERRVAWTGGKWAFDGQTLEEVVKDIGRYTNQRLQIIDPRIEHIRIGGYFDVGEIEPFLEALDTGFGIKHRHIAEDLIVLSTYQPGADGEK